MKLETEYNTTKSVRRTPYFSAEIYPELTRELNRKKCR
nr:MAG TPA: hypothetical protein [Caudoviricetes sp.]